MCVCVCVCVCMLYKHRSSSISPYIAPGRTYEVLLL